MHPILVLSSSVLALLFSIPIVVASDDSSSNSNVVVDDQQLIDDSAGSFLKRQYFISPRVGRSINWPNNQLSDNIDSFAAPPPPSESRNSPIFYLINPQSNARGHQINSRSSSKMGYIPQARVGRRAAPMGLMPMPRVGRSDPSARFNQVADQEINGEIAFANVNDSNLNDAIESLIYNQ